MTLIDRVLAKIANGLDRKQIYAELPHKHIDSISRIIRDAGHAKRLVVAKPTWTDAEIQEAITLYLMPMTASAVAEKLGRTKGSVVGKLVRVGVMGKDGTNPRPRPPAQGRAIVRKRSAERRARLRKPLASKMGAPPMQTASCPATPVEIHALADPIAGHTRITLMESTGTTCRYPLGERTERATYFCGDVCAVEVPYCSHHTQICYTTRAEQKRAAAEYRKAIRSTKDEG